MPKPATGSQDNLSRKPRVQIVYDVEIGGANRKTELPWVTGVMADLSGANANLLPDVRNREFREVTAGKKFDEFVRDQQPRLVFAVENVTGGGGRMGVDVTLESMEDFSPDVFARKVGAEITDIVLTEEADGAGKRYVFDAENPASAPFGDAISSTGLLTNEFVAYKIGEKPSDIEVKIMAVKNDEKRWTLRIVKKGPLAKLLDARNQLKELLIKVSGKAKAQDALRQLLNDEIVMQTASSDRPSVEDPG